MHTGQPGGDVGFDFHDLAVQPAHCHRERPAQRHQPTPCRWVISGVGRRPMRTPMTSMRTAAQLLSWLGQPQPGQPSQSAHLVRRHRLRHAAELVAGARLYLDEDHDAGRDVGGDHVQLAVSAAPVAGQHPQPQRRQMVDRQLLTQSADLGAGQSCHDATVRVRTDRRCRRNPVIPSHAAIHSRPGFAVVKKRVYEAIRRARCNVAGGSHD